MNCILLSFFLALKTRNVGSVANGILKLRLFPTMLLGDLLLLAATGKLQGFSDFIRNFIQGLRQRLREQVHVARYYGLQFPFFDGALVRGEFLLDPFGKDFFLQRVAANVWSVDLFQQSDLEDYLARNNLTSRAIFLDFKLQSE